MASVEVFRLWEETRRVVQWLGIQFELFVALLLYLLEVADHANREHKHILLVEVLRLTLVRGQLYWA